MVTEGKLVAMLAYLVVIPAIIVVAYSRCRSCDPLDVMTTYLSMFTVIIVVIIFALISKLLLLAALGGAVFVALTVYFAVEESQKSQEDQQHVEPAER
jgi:uncharacterized membrane protein